MARLRRILSWLVAALTPLAAQPASPVQAVVNRATETVLETHRAQTLLPDEFALTVIDLAAPAASQRGSFRGDVPIYPASVVKLFYLAAAHRWMEDEKIRDTPELRRAMRDMIVESSNDATHYIVDLLTDTTSGPELPDAELRLWFEKRNAVNRYFSGLGYTGINVNKKPWGDGPYGRETQATKLFDQKRNMLTTDATARLMAEIATGRCVTSQRSAEMMTLLARNPAAKDTDADSQARFTGTVLPSGAKLWSKAGWTSTARHDAAYVELPNGAKYVMVMFTTHHAREHEILRTAARVVSESLLASAATKP